MISKLPRTLLFIFLVGYFGYAISGETPTESEVPTEGETPAESETPTEGATPAEGEAPTEGATPAEGEAPTEGATPAEGEAPTEGATPAESEAPTEGEVPTESATPAEADVSSGDDALVGNSEAGEERYKKSCINCHGKAGKGVASYPKVSGKELSYTKSKLETYRDGIEVGPNSSLMIMMARPLTDEEIANLAAYLKDATN